jgi:hypothetical protein
VIRTAARCVIVRESENEHICIDDDKRWVDFYGLNDDEIIGVHVYPTKAQSLGGA